MGDEGRPIRLGDAMPLREPAIADLLDPLALEERLREARARRAAALAGRKAPAAPPARPDFAEAASAFLHPRDADPVDAPAAPPRIETFRTGPAAAPVVEEPSTPPLVAIAAPEPVEAAPAAPTTDRGLVRVPVWAIFATGLLLGAAVVALVVLAPTPRPTATPTASPAPVETAAAVPPATATPETAPSVTAPPETATPETATPEAPEPAADAVPPLPDILLPLLPPTATAVPVPAADLPAPAEEPAPVPADALETARIEPAVPRVIAPRPRPPVAPAAAPAEAPVTGALPARVTIHYPPSAEAEAERARAALAEAGVAEVRLLPIRLDIARSNVRFYHAADSAAANTVVGLLGTGGEAPLARDFTDYRTPAAPGALEVWLAGTAPAGRAAAPRRDPDTVATTTLEPAPTTAATTPAPAAPVVLPAPAAPIPAPAAAPAPNQAEAVARIIVERAYERLVRAIPRD